MANGLKNTFPNKLEISPMATNTPNGQTVFLEATTSLATFNS